MPRSDLELERLIDSIAEQDCDSEEAVSIGPGDASEEHVGLPLAGNGIGGHVSVLKVEDSIGLDVMTVCEREGRK